MNAQLESSGFRFEPATPERLPEIIRVLSGAGLQADDLGPTNLIDFELAIDNEGRIVGMAGLDVYAGDALLRSVVVVPDWRGKGLGETLVARREFAARAAGIGAIYLLTASARDFFHRLGYTDIARDAVPAAVASHAQFRKLCPSSAECMTKHL